MNERLFGIHGAALTLRSQRMGVIASNIANAATPGYKARDIDFNAALDARLARQRGGATAASDSAGLDSMSRVGVTDLMSRSGMRHRKGPERTMSSSRTKV